MTEGDELLIGATDYRCPKCRRQNMTVTEVTDALMDFSICDGVIERLPNTDEFGLISAVRGRCHACGHKWKVRVAQVYALVREEPSQFQPAQEGDDQ
jgi:DNA-directed RNA polymerase subunit RPC12/RpoP